METSVQHTDVNDTQNTTQKEEDIQKEEERMNESEEEEDYPVEIGPDDHPLEYGYAFWFVRRSGARTQENYEKNIKKIGCFRSVEGFWGHYNHMLRPNDLTNTSDYHMFKEGIKPMWEDEANSRGGKYIIRLKKGLASKYWEDLLLAIIGEQFAVADEICGAVVSIRYQEDILSLWNRNADNKAAYDVIADTLKTALSLPPGTVVEYKAHQAAMKDNSSFRNTAVFQS